MPRSSERAERVQFSQPRGLAGVRVLSVTGSTHRWSLFHEAYALTSVKAGHGAWKYRGREREIRPDTLMLIEPGNVHVTTKVASPAGFATLFLDASLMARLAERCGLPAGFPHFRAMDSSAPALIDRFAHVHRTLADLESENLERTEAFEEALYELFVTACEATPEEAGPALSKLLRARDFLHALQNGADDAPAKNMAGLAAEVGLTPIQLIRGFKSVFGVPPYQYLVRLRMARAQHLIAQGPTRELRSLTDVAVGAGFCDLAHMDKHFRRTLRVSPTAYASGLGRLAAWSGARRRRAV